MIDIEDSSQALSELAKRLSIRKLLEDFPDLSPKHLEKILKEAAAALKGKQTTRSIENEKPPKPHPESDKTDDLWIINFDGASRGNPGPAGAGALLQKGGRKIELTKSLGNATNNVAEYEALIIGIEEALRLGAENIEVRGDSELVVRQMNGQYQVKAPHLKPYHRKAAALARLFKKVNIVHVERGLNKEADELSNKAIDGPDEG